MENRKVFLSNVRYAKKIWGNAINEALQNGNQGAADEIKKALEIRIQELEEKYQQKRAR